jgi:hypothetical protein
MPSRPRARRARGRPRGAARRPTTRSSAPVAQGVAWTWPPRVKRSTSPDQPVIERIGSRQQMRVVATFAAQDRDVTRGPSRAATRGRDPTARSHDARRGEAPGAGALRGILRRHDRDGDGRPQGFNRENPPGYNKHDELVAAKWQRMKIGLRASAATRSSPPRLPRPDGPAPSDEFRVPSRPTDRRPARGARASWSAATPSSITGPTSGPTCSR